jgi:hypothetical protein
MNGQNSIRCGKWQLCGGGWSAIKLREYMCVSGTDALASASVLVKLKHHFQEQKCVLLGQMAQIRQQVNSLK